MKNQQSGFTLVEIAIVLVIIGLLLGGVLKGQELINSAKVKNLANDFRNIPLFIYGYQDKFRAIPGDDTRAATNISGATAPTGTDAGNGRIDGNWYDDGVSSSEATLFWQHVRLSNLAAGPTTISGAGFLPTNAEGGLIGIQSGSTTAANQAISGLTGTYVVCSARILGKFVKQLDITMDDGNTAAGSMRAAAMPSPFAQAQAAVATASIDDAATYMVCLAF